MISTDIKQKMKKLNLGLTKCREMVRLRVQVHFDKCNNFNIVEFPYLENKCRLENLKFGWKFYAENKQKYINWYQLISIDMSWYLDKILKKVKNTNKDLSHGHQILQRDNIEHLQHPHRIFRYNSTIWSFCRSSKFLVPLFVKGL